MGSELSHQWDPDPVTSGIRASSPMGHGPTQPTPHKLDSHERSGISGKRLQLARMRGFESHSPHWSQTRSSDGRCQLDRDTRHLPATTLFCIGQRRALPHRRGKNSSVEKRGWATVWEGSLFHLWKREDGLPCLGGEPFPPDRRPCHEQVPGLSAPCSPPPRGRREPWRWWVRWGLRSGWGGAQAHYRVGAGSPQRRDAQRHTSVPVF